MHLDLYIDGLALNRYKKTLNQLMLQGLKRQQNEVNVPMEQAC